MKHKIAILDDHTLFRTGLKHLVDLNNSYQIIAEFSHANDLYNYKQLNDIDALIVDINLPEISGLSVLNWLKTKNYQGKVLCLTMFSEQEYGVQCIKKGAHGFLNKSVAAEELSMALSTILKDQKYISEELDHRLTNDTDARKEFNELSYREQQVLTYLGQGLRPTDIAEKLSINIKTVSTYKRRLFTYLNLNSDADLILYCIEEGIINKKTPSTT